MMLVIARRKMESQMSEIAHKQPRLIAKRKHPAANQNLKLLKIDGDEVLNTISLVIKLSSLQTSALFRLVCPA